MFSPGNYEYFCAPRSVHLEVTSTDPKKLRINRTRGKPTCRRQKLCQQPRSRISPGSARTGPKPQPHPHAHHEDQTSRMQRSNAVATRGVGEQSILAWIAQHVQLEQPQTCSTVTALQWSIQRYQPHSCLTGNMSLCLLGGGEHARRLADVIRFLARPRDLRGILRCEDRDLDSIYHEEPFLHLSHVVTYNLRQVTTLASLDAKPTVNRSPRSSRESPLGSAAVISATHTRSRCSSHAFLSGHKMPVMVQPLACRAHL